MMKLANLMANLVKNANESGDQDFVAVITVIAELAADGSSGTMLPLNRYDDVFLPVHRHTLARKLKPKTIKMLKAAGFGLTIGQKPYYVYISW